MLIKAQQWIQTAFMEGSRPSINTVKKWHSNGEIEGTLLGGTLYIEIEDGMAAVGKDPIQRSWAVRS